MTSIRDIAKMAGVSPASVSRILNHDETFSINENTRQRVIEIANQLNYSKDKNKKNAKSNRDELSIALIVRHGQGSEKDDPYFRDIRTGIESEAARWRLRLVQVFNMKDAEKNLKQLADYGAVIMIGEMDEEATQAIFAYNQRLILVDNYSEYEGIDCVQTDFAHKTKEVLELLYNRGHRKIAFVGGLGSKVTMTGESISYSDEIRAVNYMNWMKLKNLDIHTQVYQGSWQMESGLELGRQLLAASNRPTAVVVASDPLAVGVYKAINEAKLTIPEDISVVSFDDIEMARYMTPSLTSIRMDAKEMGSLAVKMAKERMLSERQMPIRIVCSSTLEIRESIKSL
ncbi:MAG TPA: LacI family DNA-binding transcriptional regulator [Candidatus Jeotgalibaca merdavium]|uniref:LacI family DNA-binding transcriptional regulator n=1 Tax=Candidatus Jeotgalibaca merdavium TaxID=2838627 RepID=A0A9D2I203_9LACT|nr:LacI family DNA-binding transcriptional regulator [Candidatus Jeotgalibaca merdavium]